MRLKHFISVFLALLTLSIGQAWGTEYTYTSFTTKFTKGTTNGTSISTQITGGNSGTNVSTIASAGSSNFASKVTASTNCYYNSSGAGVRIAKSNGAGNFTLTFSNALKDSTIYAIVLYASKVSGNTKAVLNVTPTGPAQGGYTTVTNIGNSTLPAYDATSYAANTDNGLAHYKLDTIKVNGKKIETLNFASASGGYTMLHAITIVTQTEKAAPAPSYTIIAQSNNNTYGTVSLSGSVITATPAANHRIASDAYTVTSGTAIVERGTGANINKFTVTPSTNCTVRINFEPIPTHTVTWSANGTTSSETYQEGAAITFPNTATGCDGGTFMGWASATISGTQASAPTYVTSANMGNSDLTYYAVFATAESGGSASYKLVENNNDITAGSYLIVYNNTNALNTHYGNVGADTYGTYTSISSYYSNKVIASNATTNALAYIFTPTTNGYSIKHSETISNATKDVYVGCQKDNNTGLRWDDHFCNDTSVWVIYKDSINSFKQKARGIRWNNNSGQERFATYGKANQSAIQLFKYDPGTTYSDYRTTCCSSLGSINGSVSMTQTTAALEWADLDHVSSWAVQYKEHSAENWNTWNGEQAIANSKRSVTITSLSCGTAYDFKIAATAAAGYCDAEQVLENQSTTKWDISYSLGGTVNLSEGPEQGANACGEISATFSKNALYTFPAEITVTIGGVEASSSTDYDWDADDGMLYIDAAKVTGDVVIMIAGVAPASPIVTPDPTALSFASVKKGAAVPAAQDIALEGHNLTAALTVESSNTSLYVVSVKSGSLTPDGNKDASPVITVTPQAGITSTAGDKDATITISGGGLSEDVVVNVTFNVQETYTVNWWINGGENPAATQTDVAGEDLVVPSDFSSFTDCSDFHFIGWAADAIEGGSSDEKPELVTPITAIGTTNVNYYAVFAEGTPASVDTLMYDAFTNDETSDQSTAITAVSDNFTGSGKVYQGAYSTLKFGSSSDVGKITSKTLDLSDDFIVKMRAKKYSNDATTMYVKVGTDTRNVSTNDTLKGDFTTFTFAFEGTEETTIEIGVSNKRGYLDSVIVLQTVAEDFSMYYTTCPHVSRVTLSAESVENGSISFAQDSKAVTSVRTDGGADVEVDVVPDPATGYELTGVELSGIAGASYDASVITIPANAEGTLVATATFSQKNYSIAVGTYPAEIGAALSGATSTAKYGVEQTISTNEPTGYIFGGWYMFDASTFDAGDIDWGADLSNEIFTGTYAGGDLELSASFLMPDKNLVAEAYFDKIYTPAEALALDDLTDSVFVEGIISQVDEVSTQYKNATYWISADGTTTNQIKIYRGKHINKADVTVDNAAQIAVGNRVIVRGKLSKSSNTNQFGQGASYIYELTEKALSALTIVGDASVTTYDVGDSFDKTGLSLKATYNTGYEQANYTGTAITSDYDAPTTFTAGVTSVTVSAEEGLISTSREIAVTVSSAVLDHVELAAGVQTEFWAKEQYKEPLLNAYLNDEPATVLPNVTGVSNTTALDMSVAGDKSVTVTYTRKAGQEASVEYNFTVKPVVVDEANAHSVAIAHEIIGLDNDASEDLDLELEANKTHVIGVVTSVSALTGTNAGKYTIVIKDQTDAAKVMTLYQVTLKSGITSVEENDLIKAYGNLYYHSQSSKYEINTGGQVVWKQPKVGITIANKTLEVGDVWTIDATIDPAAAPVTYSIKDGSDDCITLATNVITATAVGTATIIAHADDYEEYLGNEKEFTVTVNPAATHTNVVILAEYSGKYYALNNEAGTTTVEMKDGIVYVPDATTKNAIIWDRAERDGVPATFKNGEKYLKGGNSTTLSASEGASGSYQWTWTVTGTGDNQKQYYTANPGENTVRSFLYQNGQGIKNYAVSNIGVYNYAQANALEVEVGIKIAPEGEDPVDVNVSTLPDDASVIVAENVTLQIDGDKSLDNLTVEAGGAVSVADNMTLEVNNFAIETTMASGKSGQLSIGTDGTFTASGEAYIDITLGAAGNRENQWHAFTVPFPVDALNGIYDAETGAKLQNEVNYAIMDYHGDIRATGNYGWKKFRGTLVPGTFYIMTVDGERPTYRFKKAAGANLVAVNSKQVYAYPLNGGNTGDNGWNGIGNPNLFYGQVNAVAYVLNPASYEYEDMDALSTNFVVGTPFFVIATENGSISMEDASGDVNYAPRRTPANSVENIKVSFGNEAYTDKLTISANEDALNEYETGKDYMKMMMSSTPKVARIFSNAYGVKLCRINTPLVNDNAEVDVTLYAPAAGEYTIAAPALEGYQIYLLQDGAIIWNLSLGSYTADLAKGNNTGYSIRIAKAPQVETGVGNVDANEAGVQKVIIDEHVFILRGEKMFDVTGKAVK